MEFSAMHPLAPDASFDGGDMDCGSGLLLHIRRNIDPLPRGGLLEIVSTEKSVCEDLPAWCRMTGNELVSSLDQNENGRYRFLVCKGALSERNFAERNSAERNSGPGSRASGGITAQRSSALGEAGGVAIQSPPAKAPAIESLSVTGIGSWPRPRWLLRAMHENLEGRLSDAEFDAAADDAVRLAVEAQLRAGVDVITDGEQRRDSYSSFVARVLDNCQLIPLTDLLPLVADPEEFERELRALDVPAGEVRHPAVFGRLGRSKPIAAGELAFARRLSAKPVKIALPGPYLLARTMWMECLSDRAYASREDLAQDIVSVLREELAQLLAEGAAMVQFDEPVLTEVVFTGAKTQRSFMCGALSEKGDASAELSFARDLLNAVLQGFPQERTALHVCRGNWTRDEAACLAGGYEPLVGMLRAVNVGNYFLEFCTPRAGSLDALGSLPEDRRLGIGVVNQKLDRVESVKEILDKARRAVSCFGPERVLFTPDCGFATFADNPLASAETAEAKLRAIAAAARQLKEMRKG